MMNKTYPTPEAATAAALRAWLEMKDRAGLVPAVFEEDEGFEPGVWPRARIDALPEGAWIVHAR